jgi:hypothetical protein
MRWNSQGRYPPDTASILNSSQRQPYPCKHARLETRTRSRLGILLYCGHRPSPPDLQLERRLNSPRQHPRDHARFGPNKPTPAASVDNTKSGDRSRPDRKSGSSAARNVSPLLRLNLMDSLGLFLGRMTARILLLSDRSGPDRLYVR